MRLVGQLIGERRRTVRRLGRGDPLDRQAHQPVGLHGRPDVRAARPGGVGVALLNQQKYAQYAGVYAIQLLILAVGIFQDYLIVALRKFCCPYADLTLERK